MTIAAIPHSGGILWPRAPCRLRRFYLWRREETTAARRFVGLPPHTFAGKMGTASIAFMRTFGRMGAKDFFAPGFNPSFIKVTAADLKVIKQHGRQNHQHKPSTRRTPAHEPLRSSESS